MKITCLAFAQARDTLGFSMKEVEVTASDTPLTILARLSPGLSPEEYGWRAALDMDFVAWDEPVGGRSELALIPPVSGG